MVNGRLLFQAVDNRSRASPPGLPHGIQVDVDQDHGSEDQQQNRLYQFLPMSPVFVEQPMDTTHKEQAISEIPNKCIAGFVAHHFEGFPDQAVGNGKGHDQYQSDSDIALDVKALKSMA